VQCHFAQSGKIVKKATHKKATKRGLRCDALAHSIQGMSATSRLIKALTTARLTQNEIARHTGIPQYRISKWQSHGAAGAADDALRLRDYAVSVLGAKAVKQIVSPE
jgi:hypothetical protein